MKKYVSLFFVLIMIFTLAACGGDGGGKSPSESSAPSAASGMTSGKTEKEEAKEYGISEAAEANGLAITIDKAEAADPNIMLEKSRDGFTYLKVYFTFKNVSDETIESPDKKDLYIVYEEGPTGDDCDMTSDNNSQVMLEVEDRNERYMEDIELAPGESTGGWMIYQRQADKDEITMHYYSGFINVPPDLVFRFTADAAAEGMHAEQMKATPESAAEPEAGMTSAVLSLNKISGTYDLARTGTSDYSQIEIIEVKDAFVLRFANGSETEYEYDPMFGVASRFAEFEDGHTVLTILTFTENDGAVNISIEESITNADGSQKSGSYEGYKTD